MIKKTDPEVYKLIRSEEKRQKDVLELIPSENYASKAVREAVGSIFMNKYSEGLPNKRYYQGNEYADALETLAIERAKAIFGVPHANVQPYSGSPANAAVFFALLNANDTLMGMSLPFGGHLTHGHPTITLSGKYFNTKQYTVEKDGYINYDEIEKLALEVKPKLIISGATAYPQIIDFKRFAEIAQKVGAYHLADISHIAGLVVAGAHPSPVPYADVVMFTTHKTMRGPRGAILLVTDKGLSKDPDLGNKIDKAVFPGLQGGPHNNTTAGIAVCLKEATSPEFTLYAQQIVKNASVLANSLKELGFELISNGTSNHLILIDLSNKNIDGWCAAWALEYAGIVLNRNSVPYDKNSAFYPSGIRLGTPAITTRGMTENEMPLIAKWMNEAINIAIELLPKDFKNADQKVSKEARSQYKSKLQKNSKLKNIRKEIKEFCANFPLP